MKVCSGRSSSGTAQHISSSSLQQLSCFSTRFYSLHQTPAASKTTTQTSYFVKLKLGNLKLVQVWQCEDTYIKLPVKTEHLVVLFQVVKFNSNRKQSIYLALNSY